MIIDLGKTRASCAHEQVGITTIYLDQGFFYLLFSISPIYSSACFNRLSRFNAHTMMVVAQCICHERSSINFNTLEGQSLFRPELPATHAQPRFRLLKQKRMTRQGIEPRTFWTYTRCSNPLSYPALPG